MRNKTLISSMVLSVACVSAANAGVVDPFTTTQTPPPYGTFVDITGGIFNQRALVKTGGGSGSVSGGSVNFVADSSVNNTGMAFGLQYRQDVNESSIDLSGISMSFNLTATGGYRLLWVFEDATGKGADVRLVRGKAWRSSRRRRLRGTARMASLSCGEDLFCSLQSSARSPRLSSNSRGVC